MTNQRNPKPRLDEYEDLTRFADENFDTDEVDLFQFSGNSETSPLTKLKSVILSLEWEITDEYLQELAEELAALTPSLQDDKVANLYLQGMGKIGKYLRLRGAHAHANAIKLLLKYFYDFESILNSPDMDNDRINRIVQNDVRMFRVLQYQIKLAEEDSGEGEGPAGMTKDVVRDTGKASNALRSFKAAVLELDWEVNDSSLQFFSDALKSLSEEEIQNKSALILIQGMQALGDYISEERAHAHPEVFNLLHAFHDGLERILDTGPAALDQKQKKRILVDRINRLNHLKKLIAPQNAEVPQAVSMAQAVAEAQSRGPAAPAVEETPVPEAPAADEPSLFDEPAPALADTEAPVAPAAPIPGVYTDDYDDDDVDPRFGSVAPALSDVAPALSDVPAPDAPAEEPMLFDDDVTPALADASETPAAPIPGVYTDDYDDDDVDPRFGSVAPALSDVTPALSDAEAPAAPADDAALFEDIAPALSDAEPAPAFADIEPEIKEAPATSADIASEIDGLFPPSAKKPAGDEIAPALADADTEPALSFAEETGAPADADLDMELDAFFGESTETPPPPEAPVAPVSPAAAVVGDEDDELDLFPPTSQTDDLPSALSDADMPEETLELGAEDAELSSKLDSFFDFPSESSSAAPEAPAAPADDTLLFEETPAAPEAPATPADDTLLFDEMPAAAPTAEEDEALFIIEEPAAPAQSSNEADLFAAAPAASADDTFLLDEAPAAPVAEASHDDMPPALFDAEHPEDAGESLIFEADEELSAHLDNFFDFPSEPAPASASPAEDFATAETAPADDMLLFEEEAAAPAEALLDETPAALADVGPEEETLTIEEDDELSAHLDNFFDLPSEPAPALAEESPAEEPGLFLDESDMTAEAPAEPATSEDTLFSDEPAPAFAEESPAEEPGLFLDESDMTAEAPAEPAASEDTLFADEPAPAFAEESPAEEPGLFLDESDMTAEAPAEPAASEDTPFADEPAPAFAAESPSDETGLFLDESDLAMEETAGETTLFADAPIDEAPALDIPEDEQEAAQPKVFEEVVAALADVEPGRGKKVARVSTEAEAGFQDQLDSFFDQPQSQEAPSAAEEASVILDETPSAPVEEAPVVEEVAVADDAGLFAESADEATAAPADDTLLFEEPKEETASDTLTLDDNLFAPEETDAPAPSGDDDVLRLEKKAAPADFDDLVNPDEVRDFLTSEGDIEDISDEELAFSEEEDTVAQPAPEEPPLEAALNGAFDEPPPSTPLFGEEEKDTLAAMDDLFGAQDEGTRAHSPAWSAETVPAVEDVVAEESVLFAAPEETFAPEGEEPVAATSVSGMASLAESLPALTAGYTADQLDDCRRRIEELRQEGSLSPVQTAAAGMLDSVLTGLPEASEKLDAATATLLEGLYVTLAEPQAQLPIETVTAYSAWVQSHVSGKHRQQPAPAPDSESRALIRELSEFRSRMEQELAQLREELKKR